MADEQSSSKNFFTTLPGIITAIAGLITAVGGFILILNKTGCAGSKVDDTEKTEQQVVKDSDKTKNKTDDTDRKKEEINIEANKGNVFYSPGIVKHLTRYLVYKIEEANAEILPDNSVVLNVKLKCTNNSDYEYHFYKNYLGAKIGDDNYGPDPFSPSGGYQSIPPRSFKELEYNFKLPRYTNKFNLDFYDGDALIGTSAFSLK